MSHQVSLTWSEPSTSDPASSFNIHRAAAQAGPFAVIGSATALTYTDTAVVAGTTYWYEVTAVNSAGESGPSNEVSATVPLLVPAAPSGLTATAS